MLEPYFKSSVFDMSGGLLPVPADDGFNVVMPVYTPTGPIEKTKVFSQKDFLDRFMTSSKILPSDHISAQFAYLTLASNPVYVMRACRSDTILEGMTSEGKTLLFDRQYNKLSSYKKFKLDISLTNPTYTITKNDSTLVTGNDIDQVFEDLYNEGNKDCVLSVTPTQVISTQPLVASESIGKFAESISTGVYDIVTFDSTKDLEYRDWVSINSNTYQCLSDPNISPTVDLPNVTGFYPKKVEDHEEYCRNPFYMGLFIVANESCPVSISSDAQITNFGNQVESNVPNLGTADNSANLRIGARVDINKGSLGILSNSRVVSDLYDLSTVPPTNNNAAPWSTDDCWDKQPGDIFLSPDHDEAWVVDESVTHAFSTGDLYDISVGAQGSSAGWPEAPSENNHYNLSSTGRYLVVKDDRGNITRYDLINYVIIDEDSGLDFSAVSTYDSEASAPLGAAVRFDSSRDLAIGAVRTKIKSTNDLQQYAVDIPNACSICVKGAGSSPQNKTFIFYNSDEAPAGHLNQELSEIIVYSISAKTNIEFLIKVLDFFAKTGGNHAAAAPNIHLSGILKLYNPSYGSTSIGGNGEGVGERIILAPADENTKTYYYAVDPANNEALVKYNKIAVQINNKTYYTGDYNPAGGTSVSLSDKACSEAEFMALLEATLMNDGYYKFKDWFISTDTSIEISDPGAGDTATPEYTLATPNEVVEQNTTDTFAIVAKFPSTQNLFRYSYSYDDDTKIISLVVNYKNGLTVENWTMSFVPGVTDSYGIDQWYERVQSNYFQVVALETDTVPLHDEDHPFESVMFGGGVAVPAYDNQLMSNAISDITNYEDGVHYDAISDAGVSDLSLAKTIIGLTKTLWAMYPASLPATLKEAKDVATYARQLVASGNFETVGLAASDRIAVGTFSNVIPGSYSFLGKMIQAFRSGSQEFAPIAGINHGTVGVANLVQSWKKADREALLDVKVATLKGGITTPYYINQNITMQSEKSYMSEEQNVRMTNAAVHVVESMAPNYLHELNTRQLRAKVQENVNAAIQDRLFKGKAYTPAQYLAVCDDSNNTPQTIDQNKLIISLYASFTPSIHYTLIDHFIIPLDQVTT